MDIAVSCGGEHAPGCTALLELLATAQALDRELHHELGNLGLTANGFGILTVLWGADPKHVGVGELAEQLQMAKPVVSSSLARLEIARLIIRSRTPDNRRLVTVCLTDLGCETIEAAFTHFESKINTLMHDLRPDEVAVLIRACRQLKPAGQASAAGH